MNITEHQVTVVLSWALFVMCLVTFIFRFDLNYLDQSWVTSSAAFILLLNLGAYLKWRWPYTRHVAVSVITIGCALYFDERYFQIAFPAGMLFAPAMALMLLKKSRWVVLIGAGQFLVILIRLGLQPGISIVSVTMYFMIMGILIIARIISDNAREQAQFNEKSAQKAAEKLTEKNLEIEGVNFNLGQEIQQRKSLEGQLFQAQKMESVGRLAGGVAHDYNNMLSIILGYAELALAKIDPKDPLHEDLTEILDAGHRSADITKQLLAFARQQATDPRALKLNDNIESMLKMLHRLIGEDIELIWVPDDELWTTKIDPHQNDQILANLCVNARDAIAGTGKIIIETRNSVLDDEYCANHTDCVSGEFVLLSVSDDGQGISPESIDKVFEPFFTTKSLHQGTGLGLSTVYGIVKQNNGFVNIYSELDKGTTIKIYLPRYTGQIAVPKPEPALGMLLSQGETVLVVEDDPSILRLCKKMLKSQGYTVLAANTPNEAIIIFKRHAGTIHLLLTDVVMPEMNGRELSEELTKQQPDLKTLFMSGYTADVIAHSGVLNKNVNFISKPLSKQELARKIRETLERNH